MEAWVVRILLFLICGWGGYELMKAISSSSKIYSLGVIGGFLLAGLIILLEERLKKIPLRSLLGSFIGLIIGVVITYLIFSILLSPFLGSSALLLPLSGLLYGVLGYIGLRIGTKKGEEFHFAGSRPFTKISSRSGNPKILDTSVIIDGRIADITETGFLEGTILIPTFILNELQRIADSSDPIKRTRGKRGLEILNHLQKQANTDVQIIDTDYASIREVDAKLIELAKQVGGKIVTNDSNLNKVAELQGIEVLNINVLANSLRPIVLPGEEINVKILKEGKETGQGIAYLDDGTMIVVDNGRRQIGKNVEVIVTTVLQTPAGRMIFAKLKEEAIRESRGKDYYYPFHQDY
ncbi:MAG: PIN/TRAM domain-containing protein [Thermodesulfobacteriota bacterium]